MKRHQSLADAVRKLIDAGFIDATLACPDTPIDQVYFEEVIDSFALLSPSQREQAFPFFDAEFYTNQLNAELPEHINPLNHFLEFGIASLLSPHPLIQPRHMFRARPDLLSDAMALKHFVSALTRDWCDPSPFVWLTWYRARTDIEPDQCALAHYLRRGAALNIPPNPFFQPAAYAAAAPDAPQSGIALVKHFFEHGDSALTPVGDRFDPEWYAASHPESKAEGMGPLCYFLAIGRSLGHAPREAAKETGRRPTLSGPTSDMVVTETSGSAIERWSRFKRGIAEARRARRAAFKERPICPVKIEDHAAALKDVAFAAESAPDVDILISCYNEFEITVECLVALQRAPKRRKFRIIIVDDASPDERLLSFKSVPGLTVIRNPENLHFLRSCNSAFAATSAPYLLILNNDTQVLDDAIDRLIDVLEEEERAGASVPMFLYPNGRLQEAGCTLRYDGESTMIGVGDDPGRPGYNHRREVEYGSGAALMLKREALDGKLFDELFAPAYCEDADLCLRIRDGGWRVIYEPRARIVHHLSVSTNRASRHRRIQQVRANQQKLMAKWSPQLRQNNRARVLAFYLPQFHPIDRNNVWWGPGFTEWTNVTRATPSFVGHYQPHLPADLGYYDLRRVETLGEQQALARRYGIEGFAVYYYNFGSIRVLEQPMEALLRHPEVDFRFALCWANENWTRHWDGGARSILMEQLYDAATLDSVASDMARFASDPRAIRVDGKPLVMIYRPLLIPDIAKVAAVMRDVFKRAGHPAIHLVYVESMEMSKKRAPPEEIGFDACVEFPPHGFAQRYSRSITPLKAGWEGALYDYEGTARNFILRETVDYTRYPAVTPSWDSTARQPLKGATLVGAEPELFQAYVEEKLEEMLNANVGDHRLLFVNAWNEWAEGAHLEPDRSYGHRWLAALKNALLAKGVAP